MFQAAHEELQVHNPFLPLSRASAATVYNGDVAAASSANKAIDLAGFDEALIIVSQGAIAAGAALTYNVKCADNNTANDATLTQVTDGTPANASCSFADTDDNKTKLIRVRCRDVKRYLFVERVETGAVADVGSVVVILTKAQKKPVSQIGAVGGAVSTAFTHAS